MVGGGKDMEEMREILFKAKRIDNGEWVEGYLFDDGFENGRMFVGGIVIEEYKGTACDEWNITGIDFCEVDPYTICQYTGLTDKNGNKIWENDVVEIPTENGYFTIEWSDTEARWQMDNEIDNFIVDFDNYWSYEVELIGNIFDNADLLKGE